MVQPAANWIELENQAARAASAALGNLNGPVVLTCPVELALQAQWETRTVVFLSSAAAAEKATEWNGKRVPRRTIRYAAKNGHIPGSVKDGRGWRIPEDGLRLWLEKAHDGVGRPRSW